MTTPQKGTALYLTKRTTHDKFVKTCEDICANFKQRLCGVNERKQYLNYLNYLNSTYIHCMRISYRSGNQMLWLVVARSPFCCLSDTRGWAGVGGGNQNQVQQSWPKKIIILFLKKIKRTNAKRQNFLKIFDIIKALNNHKKSPKIYASYRHLHATNPKKNFAMRFQKSRTHPPGTTPTRI